MYRSFWISLFLLPLVVGPLQLQAQEPPPPTGTDVAIQKEKASLKPFAARFGANIFRLGRTAFDDEYASWDVTGDVVFHKYFIEVSYGRERNTLSTPDFDYENRGSFFRIGPEANFVKDKTEGNAFVFGLKYVFGSYSEDFTFDLSNPIFGTETIELNNSSLNSRWLEMNIGVKARIWEQLYAGFYFRYKFLSRVNGEQSFETYQIPGFGLEDQSTVVGFDYYLFWRIPFKKSPKILDEL